MLVAGHNSVMSFVTRKIVMCRDEACLVRDENGVFVDRAGPVPTPNHAILHTDQHAAPNRTIPSKGRSMLCPYENRCKPVN